MAKRTSRRVTLARKLRAEGRSFREIAEILSKDGVALSEASIRKWLRDSPATPPKASPRPLVPSTPSAATATAGSSRDRVVTRAVRGPLGFVVTPRDAAWHARREELVEREDDAKTCDDASAARLDLALHECPEAAAWLADPRIAGDIVEAVLEAGIGDELLLVSSPAAFAALAAWVSEAPTDGDPADTSARAVALLEGALAIVGALEKGAT